MTLLSRLLKIKFLQAFCRIKKQNRRRLGKAGEAIAHRYLKRHGYLILEQNYSTPVGEIDIIAEDKDMLVFVEVKMRRSDTYGQPYEAIDYKKIRKLTKLAQLYVKRKNLYYKPVRFDVVSILAQRRLGRKSIRLIKNAFYAEE